jgi:hypothetical protein
MIIAKPSITLHLIFFIFPFYIFLGHATPLRYVSGYTALHIRCGPVLANHPMRGHPDVKSVLLTIPHAFLGLRIWV